MSWKFFTDGAVARPLKSTRQDDNGSYRLSLWWKMSNRSSCRKFCAPCTAKIVKMGHRAQRVKCDKMGISAIFQFKKDDFCKAVLLLIPCVVLQASQHVDVMFGASLFP